MILWAIACWGKHVDLFNRFHVPSMLLRGNLGTLQAYGPVTLWVFTRHEDVEALRPALAKLEQIVTVDIGFIGDDTIRTARPHKIMADMQRHAVARAVRERSGLAWTYPDTIMPEGQYAGLGEDLERDGIGAVFGSGVGTKLGKIPALDTILHEPKRFADLLFSHEMIHPFSQAKTVSAFGPTTSHPSALYWRSQDGLVCHAFHLNPLICWPTETNIWTEGLDGDFIDRATFAGPAIRVAETFTMAELCGPEKTEGLEDGRQKSPTDVALWAAMNVTRPGLQSFAKQIRLGGCPENDWAQIQATELSLKAMAIQRRMNEAVERMTGEAA